MKKLLFAVVSVCAAACLAPATAEAQIDGDANADSGHRDRAARAEAITGVSQRAPLKQGKRLINLQQRAV